MATLMSGQVEQSKERLHAALLPVGGDSGVQALNVARLYGPFVVGDSVIVASTAAFHIRAGTSGIVATTADPLFPAGVYKFTVPDGCTHLSMIDSGTAAGSGQAYKG